MIYVRVPMDVSIRGVVQAVGGREAGLVNVTARRKKIATRM